MWAPIVGMYEKFTSLNLGPSVMFGNTLRYAFGLEEWIVRVDDLEYIIGWYVWIGSICILGGI